MSPVPLPTLLSQAFVAFTIEVDNEFEHRMPTRVSIRKAPPPSRPDAPWLTSLAMYSNVLAHIPDEGIAAKALPPRARVPKETIKINLAGMARWGYLRLGELVVPTPAGRDCKRVWQPLPGEVEARWGERFGSVVALREALVAVLDERADQMPDLFPMIAIDMRAREAPADSIPTSTPADERPLLTLLSQVLLSFTLDVERDADLALATSANLLRVLDESGVRVRDLPARSGVSKEAQAMMLGFVEKRRLVVVEPDPTAARGKHVRLTAAGAAARAHSASVVDEVEATWRERHGGAALDALRATLEPIVGDGTSSSPLFAGLEPYDDCWRSTVATPELLPHHPMVLHRGGYPDGS